MRTLIAATNALLLATSLAASASAARFGNRLVTEGDSVGTVRQAAGTPDRIVTIENDRGAAIGERWEYYRADGTTVFITIKEGRVSKVEETH